MDSPNFVRLHSPDPSQRKEAIIAAGNARDQAAVATLTHLAENDPVPELRDLAAKAIHHITQQVPPAQFQVEPSPERAQLYASAGDYTSPTNAGWTCPTCATTGIQGNNCPNCGTPRPGQSTVPVSNGGFDDKSRKPGGFSGLTASGMQTVLLFLVGVALLTFLAVREWQKYQALTRDGVEGTAQVSDRHVTIKYDSNNRETKDYDITYTYTVNGRTYSADSSIDSNQYDNWPIGTTLQIIYSKSDPSQSQLGSRPDNLYAIGFTVLDVVCVGALLVSLLRMFSGSA